MGHAHNTKRKKQAPKPPDPHFHNSHTARSSQNDTHQHNKHTNTNTNTNTNTSKKHGGRQLRSPRHCPRGSSFGEKEVEQNPSPLFFLFGRLQAREASWRRFLRQSAFGNQGRRRQEGEVCSQGSGGLLRGAASGLPQPSQHPFLLRLHQDR